MPISQEILERLQADDPTLTSLSLEANQINDADAAYLAQALKDNTTLTDIDLGYNRISAVGVEHLARALKDNIQLTSLSLRYDDISDAGALHLALALKDNYTLLRLGSVSSPKIKALLDRNAQIADCLKLLKDFTTPGRLSMDEINEAIERLYKLAPELHDEDNPLPEDHNLSEAHRLLCALSHLQAGHPAGALTLLESPLRHPAFAMIANKAYVEALMVSEIPEDKTRQVIRYKLLTYCGRHDTNSFEFATGLAGLSVSQDHRSDVKLVHDIHRNPGCLPNGTDWVSYDELQSLAKRALAQAAAESYEHQLLDAAIAQKDYHPAIVDLLFKSPLFIQTLKLAYPNQSTFQCLEGYLELQHCDGLGGVYALPPEDSENAALAEVDEATFTHAIAALNNLERPYASVQDEITALKQLMTPGFELMSDDSAGLESKKEDGHASETSANIDSSSVPSESGLFSSKGHTSSHDGMEEKDASQDEDVEDPRSQLKK